MMTQTSHQRITSSTFLAGSFHRHWKMNVSGVSKQKRIFENRSTCCYWFPIMNNFTVAATTDVKEFDAFHSGMKGAFGHTRQSETWSYQYEGTDYFPSPIPAADNLGKRAMVQFIPRVQISPAVYGFRQYLTHSGTGNSSASPTCPVLYWNLPIIKRATMKPSRHTWEEQTSGTTFCGGILKLTIKQSSISWKDIWHCTICPYSLVGSTLPCREEEPFFTVTENDDPSPCPRYSPDRDRHWKVATFLNPTSVGCRLIHRADDSRLHRLWFIDGRGSDQFPDSDKEKSTVVWKPYNLTNRNWSMKGKASRDLVVVNPLWLLFPQSEK